MMAGLLAVVYGAAFLSKLNSAFIASDTSCAVKFYGNIRGHLSILPEGEWVYQGIIWGTLALELVLCVGFLRRRWHRVTVVTLCLFHGALALDTDKGFINFSAVMISMASLVLLPNVLHANGFRNGTLGRLWGYWLSYRRLLVLLLGLAPFVWVFREWEPIWLLRGNHPNLADLWILQAAFSLLSVYALTMTWVTRSPPGEVEGNIGARKGRLIVSLCLLIAFGNAMGPYLGFKTRTAFNMYGNLRIEADYSNHLWFDRSFDLFSILSKRVEFKKLPQTTITGESSASSQSIVETQFEWERQLLRTPTHRFRSKLEDEWVEGTGQDLLERYGIYSSWMHKVLVFKPLDERGERSCIW